MVSRALWAALAACALITGVSAIDGPFPVPFPTAQFENTEPLREGIQLFWTVDQISGTVLLGIASRQSPGWLGLGFSDNGGMVGADIVVGRVDSAATGVLGQGSTPGFVLEDRHAPGFVEPKMDIKPSITPVFGYQDANITAFVFNRSLTTPCSFEGASISLKRFQWVIYAFGTSNTFGFHGENRGQKQIFFVPPKVQFEAQLPADALKITVATPPVIVPANETTMYCYSLHRLPADRAYHVVREEPLITSPRLHHSILYDCSTDNQIKRAQAMFANESVRCVSYSKPDTKEVGINPCTAFWTGWALGGGVVDMPKDVGRPMGARGARIVVLELHLDNSKGDADTTDASGLILHYTPTLRAMDMGVLPLGILYQQLLIPANTDFFTLSSVCPSACTQQMSQAVTIHGSFFHMHTHGRAMRTRIIRKDTELEPMGQRLMTRSSRLFK